jgi:hypothetical protein
MFCRGSVVPGRPDFHCASTQNVLARIELRGKEAIVPLLFEPGANHYRFIGLEVTRAGDQTVSALATARRDGPVDHVVFDGVWMHGTGQDETTRAIYLAGMSHVAVVDSILNGPLGVCPPPVLTTWESVHEPVTATQNKSVKNVNDFLEAAGENVLFGGRPLQLLQRISRFAEIT